MLVLTADATPVASERALGSGAQDFVIKPFSIGEVLVRVRNLLRARFVYTALQSAIAHRREAVLRALWLTDSLNSEQQAAERLRFLDGVKDTLLQTVSHDLRNPIWAMLLLTDVLADDADGTRPLPADTRSGIISKIQHSARQMERLLEDILDSDPMRAVNGDHDPCEVGDVVNRVLAEVDLGRDHPLEVTIAPVQADVDPAHLERIVENLLSNARQHVAPGVPIWVTVARCTGWHGLLRGGCRTRRAAGHRREHLRTLPARSRGGRSRGSALASRSSPGSPSCTVVGHGPKNGTAAGRRSGCSCPRRRPPHPPRRRPGDVDADGDRLGHEPVTTEKGNRDQLRTVECRGHLSARAGITRCQLLKERKGMSHRTIATAMAQ